MSEVQLFTPHAVDGAAIIAAHTIAKALNRGYQATGQQFVLEVSDQSGDVWIVCRDIETGRIVSIPEGDWDTLVFVAKSLHFEVWPAKLGHIDFVRVTRET